MMFLSLFYMFRIKKESMMSHKITVCITETLQRVIEVDVDEMDGDAIEYVRR